MYSVGVSTPVITVNKFGIKFKDFKLSFVKIEKIVKL